MKLNDHDVMTIINSENTPTAGKYECELQLTSEANEVVVPIERFSLYTKLLYPDWEYGR